MRALVTGGAGFIGSALVDRLLAEGHAVDVVDDLSTGSLRNLSSARSRGGRDLTFHQLDVRSPDLRELMGRRHVDVVFHLAARPVGRGSVDQPVLDADVNILGSLNTLEGARAAGVAKVVFASSSAIYGDPPAGAYPVKEAMAQHPRTPHGVAKKAVGDYLVAYRALHDLEFTALVLAQVYGPRQDPAGAEAVVAALVGPLVEGRPPTIHGDGAQTYDLVFVDDVVDAFARAATRGSGLLMNIGTGLETSAAALFLAAAAGTGQGAPALPGPALPNESLRTALDPARAALHLGWRPWTTVAEGLAATIEWHRSAGAGVGR